MAKGLGGTNMAVQGLGLKVGLLFQELSVLLYHGSLVKFPSHGTDLLRNTGHPQHLGPQFASPEHLNPKRLNPKPSGPSSLK